jgi:hypothetical protein
VIVCGFNEIDGWAFCSGVASLKLTYENYPRLQSLIASVTYLIKGAIFRSKYATNPSRVSLNIRPLRELVDMYHTHEATHRRDKVFALLGMSSDDDIAPGLSPDYKVQWEQLFEKLVKFLLFKEVSVETSDSEKAVIRSKGCILGLVSSVRSDEKQNATIISKNAAWCLDDNIEWTLQASAKSIREGDIICLLQGASRPTIIRLCKDYFAVVIIAATPLNESRSFEQPERFKSVMHFPRDFLLVWDWENHLEDSQDQEEYKALTLNSQVPQYSKAGCGDHLNKATRLWNVALALGDLEEYEKAEERLREAIGCYETAKQLFETYEIEINAKSTDLLWIARGGNEAVVKLLLETGKVDIDIKDKDNRTPLLWAALGGHRDVVKQLLGTRQVEIDIKDKDGRTPLFWAAKKGHEVVVEHLLKTGKVDINAKDKDNQTSLSWAIRREHKAVVKLLQSSTSS